MSAKDKANGAVIGMGIIILPLFFTFIGFMIATSGIERDIENRGFTQISNTVYVCEIKDD